MVAKVIRAYCDSYLLATPLVRFCSRIVGDRTNELVESPSFILRMRMKEEMYACNEFVYQSDKDYTSEECSNGVRSRMESNLIDKETWIESRSMQEGDAHE